jgi:hypothetical protein
VSFDGVKPLVPKIATCREVIPFRDKPWQTTFSRTVHSAFPEELPCPHALRMEATTTLTQLRICSFNKLTTGYLTLREGNTRHYKHSATLIPLLACRVDITAPSVFLCLLCR